MTREPCARCPFRDGFAGGLPCPRWPSDHTPFCDWMDPTHPHHRADGAAILAHVARDRAGLPPASPPAPAGTPDDPSPPARPSPAVRSQLLALARAKACPYRDPCGCNAATCWAGYGPGTRRADGTTTVYLADCLACLARAANPTGGAP